MVRREDAIKKIENLKGSIHIEKIEELKKLINDIYDDFEFKIQVLQQTIEDLRNERK